MADVGTALVSWSAALFAVNGAIAWTHLDAGRFMDAARQSCGALATCAGVFGLVGAILLLLA